MWRNDKLMPTLVKKQVLETFVRYRSDRSNNRLKAV